jgi:hypothetical protein
VIQSDHLARKIGLLSGCAQTRITNNPKSDLRHHTFESSYAVVHWERIVHRTLSPPTLCSVFVHTVHVQVKRLVTPWRAGELERRKAGMNRNPTTILLPYSAIYSNAHCTSPITYHPVTTSLLYSTECAYGNRAGP